MKVKDYRKVMMLLILALTGLTVAQAKVQLSNFIGDNMVLQQKEKVKIWGTSTFSGQHLNVNTSWNNKTYQVQINQQGQWEVYLETPVYGGPYQITLDDGDKLTLNNILIGEVWFCSGQSNMEMPLAGWGKINHYQQEINSANFPNIRILQIPKSTSNLPITDSKVETGGWNSVSPQSIAEFSATAYFFAREIYEKTGIPIGLIHSSWGGTIIETWMSRQGLAPFTPYTSMIEKIQRPDAQELFNKEMEVWNTLADKQDKGKPGTEGSWLSRNIDIRAWDNISIPSYYDKNLFPGMDGVIYFRKDIELPKHWIGRNIRLILGTVDDNDITYVNGQFVGETNGYNLNRNYTISGVINDQPSLHIAMRVFDGGGEGGIYSGSEQPRLEGPNGETLSLVGEWKCKVGYDLNQLPPKPNTMEGPNRPTVLYNAMVQPFVDFKIKGVIWYQGESNTETKDSPYNELLPGLIKDWRTKWNNENMPFYYVQLANFKDKIAHPEPSSWAILRDAQLSTLKVPHTGMAVIADIGEAGDIHPKNKQDVGKRLAFIALNKLYGKTIAFSGPSLKNWSIKGHEVQLNFDPMGKKLALKSLDKTNGGFTIAGKDQVFYPAEIKQIGRKIRLSAKEVSAPVAVRYGWADNPDLILYNDAGLPASPFRTDNWNN
ncbi:9-O-acetylesterase [Sphingobacterium sp. SRCM116780]|uniref:sialate O-acetylesterase n=1 Tax=Sphingobacterium sp. SRCM116780 TaxID=2907623 RepID=UPI001F240E67|nr:sialate O-acetylesterase [Sphingobacterium sp. SRCM116780]UIR54816.1 9-O-acetylesterase [Sphingobacterium sp. SRCM116780]